MLHKTTGLPGRSKEHSPIKLQTFKIVLGRTCGILAHGKCFTDCYPCFRYYELTAGDGEFNGSVNSTSVSVSLSMCRDLAKKKLVRMFLFEKSRKSYHKLVENIPKITDYLGFAVVRKEVRKEKNIFIARKDMRLSLNIEAVRADCKTVYLPQKQKQAQFILLDGNSAQQNVKAAKSIIGRMTIGTTFMISMGFNASGTKVLQRKYREKWMGFVRSLTNQLPDWHDCIIVVVHTGHQWRHLIRIPKGKKSNWVDEVRKRILKIAGLLNCKVSCFSLKKNPDEFWNIAESSCFTSKELSN